MEEEKKNEACEGLAERLAGRLEFVAAMLDDAFDAITDEMRRADPKTTERVSSALATAADLLRALAEHCPEDIADEGHAG